MIQITPDLDKITSYSHKASRIPLIQIQSFHYNSFDTTHTVRKIIAVICLYAIMDTYLHKHRLIELYPSVRVLSNSGINQLKILKIEFSLAAKKIIKLGTITEHFLVV